MSRMMSNTNLAACCLVGIAAFIIPSVFASLTCVSRLRLICGSTHTRQFLVIRLVNHVLLFYYNGKTFPKTAIVLSSVKYTIEPILQKCCNNDIIIIITLIPVRSTGIKSSQFTVMSNIYHKIPYI